MELRENGITMPVLILGHTPKEEVPLLIEHHITQAVTCQAKALEYSQEAVRCGGTLKVHIKVDTGMSRLGFLTAGEHFGTGVEAICAACRLPGLEVEGLSLIHISTATFIPSRRFTPPQTISRMSPPPMSVLQTFSLSAFGCWQTSCTTPTIIWSKRRARSSASSTSTVDIVRS